MKHPILTLIAACLIVTAFVVPGSTVHSPMYKVGDHFPDIKINDPSGKEMALYDIKDKFILVDFWASWCGPCRAENPNIVGVYEKYKKAKFKEARGFEVFSVSLDYDSEKWKKAIEADNLTWKYHVSQLKGWNSEVAKEFGINSIPTSYLIGPDHKVIGVNLKGMALHEAIDEHIKSL